MKKLESRSKQQDHKPRIPKKNKKRGLKNKKKLARENKCRSHGRLKDH
jgi:hypothetical protein